MSTTVEHCETVFPFDDAPTDAAVVDGEPEPAAAVEDPGGWLSRVWSGLGWVLGRVLWRLWRAVSWVFRSRWRLVTSSWLMGFFLVGQAGVASADGLIVGPDLGSGGGQTVFERFGPEKYTLYLHLSDSHHGGVHVEESMWTILNAVEIGLMYLIAALARGAITSMEWLLNLTLYSDHQVAIDSAVAGVANAVFWPLFGTTLAIGAMVAYGRMKREGGGSLWNDASWLIAASVFAAMFATAPSLVLKDMDDARTMLSDGLMVGYSTLGPVGDSSAGFPAVKVPGDQKGATRQLADGMWNVFVVTPWCYANFNDMSICHDVGKDYLTNDQRWQNLNDWMDGKNGGNTDEKKGAYCPKELNAQCDWIRGQSFGRLGALLFILIVTLPLVLVLLALVLYGLMAIVGFLLLALSGVIFLLFWMIPGRPRQIGVKWLEELIGALLQSVIITTVIGSVMVLDSFLAAGIPKYGFFAVALLDLATFVTGFRMRGRLENVVGMGAGSGASPFSGYMAMRGLGALGKRLGKAGKAVSGLDLKAARGGVGAVNAFSNSSANRALFGSAPGSGGRQAPLRSRPLPTNPTGPGPGQGGGARPPGSRPGGGSGPTSSGPGRTGRHTGPTTNGSSSSNSGASGAGAGPGSASGASPAGAAAAGAVVGAAAAGRRRSARAGSGQAGTGTAAPSTANGSTNGSSAAAAPAGTANGSSNGSTNGSRPAGAPAGTANGSGGGSHTANGQAAAGNSATGSTGTRSSSTATAGAVGAAAVRSGGGSRRAGSGSGSGAGGRGEQHLSPPVRTGPARAVRRGSPTVSAPALPDRPLVSRPLPTNPTAPSTPQRPGTAVTPPQRSASGNGTSRPTGGGSSRAGASTAGRPAATGRSGAAAPGGNAAIPQPSAQRPTGGSGGGGQSRRTPQPPAAPPRPPRQRSPLPPPPPTRPRRQDPPDERGPR
jgi:hypothetical protein